MIETFQGPYRFLSNFYPAEVESMGMRFATVEHAYQASKCVNQQDILAIWAAPMAADAKKIGRKVEMHPWWEDFKLGVMEALLFEKFSDPDLRAKLLATGDEELQEGNTWDDRFWGRVLEGSAGGDQHWDGQNHLGRLLMLVREEIRADLAAVDE